MMQFLKYRVTHSIMLLNYTDYFIQHFELNFLAGLIIQKSFFSKVTNSPNYNLTLGFEFFELN